MAHTLVEIDREIFPIVIFPLPLIAEGQLSVIGESIRVATVREKYLENEIFPRSGKSQGILWMAREI